jgi:DNA polymerase
MYSVDFGWARWVPGMLPPSLPESRVVVAHGAMNFDSFMWKRMGWPKPDRWVDTVELARRAGLPGGLDKLGRKLLHREKDIAGSRFTLKFSRPKRPDTISVEQWRAMPTSEKRRHGTLGLPTGADLDRIVAYCARDVEVMLVLWPHVVSFLDLEPAVEAVDRAVNARGIGFDRELAVALLAADAGLQRKALATAGISDPRELRSPVRFREAIYRAGGGELPDAQKATVEALLEDAILEVRALAAARLSLASIARGKLEAGLARVSPEGRLQDNTKYYGAHTGRWSGQGMQLQNLPRPTGEVSAKWTDAQVCQVADVVRAGDLGRVDDESMQVLLRACLCAAPGMRLVAADYSSVEARANAWSANDWRALRVFTSGQDVYCTFAAHVFNTMYSDLRAAYKAGDLIATNRRQLGKIAELGLGYGMGAVKFEATCQKAGIDLAANRLTAHQVVASWRELHTPIVDFWRALEQAAKRTVATGVSTSLAQGRYRFECHGEDTWLVLPSGRPIVYHQMRLSGVDETAKANAALEADGLIGSRRNGSLVYEGPLKREWTYGGKLCENAIQAMCRDLLAEALVRAEQIGLRPVLHVHDEIVVEVPEAYAEDALEALKACMVWLPGWAMAQPGLFDAFPATCEGFICRRYRK